MDELQLEVMQLKEGGGGGAGAGGMGGTNSTGSTGGLELYGNACLAHGPVHLLPPLTICVLLLVGEYCWVSPPPPHTHTHTHTCTHQKQINDAALP